MDTDVRFVFMRNVDGMKMVYFNIIFSNIWLEVM